MKSIKLNIYSVDNITDCYAELLEDAEHLESAGDSNPDHLGYINCIFETNFDSRFCLWDIQNYKEVT